MDFPRLWYATLLSILFFGNCSSPTSPSKKDFSITLPKNEIKECRYASQDRYKVPLIFKNHSNKLLIFPYNAFTKIQENANKQELPQPNLSFPFILHPLETDTIHYSVICGSRITCKNGQVKNFIFKIDKEQPLEHLIKLEYPNFDTKDLNHYEYEIIKDDITVLCL